MCCSEYALKMLSGPPFAATTNEDVIQKWPIKRSRLHRLILAPVRGCTHEPAGPWDHPQVVDSWSGGLCRLRLCRGEQQLVHDGSVADQG